jgi:integrase
LSAFVAEGWLPDLQASVQQERRRSSTVYQYGQDVKGHILPALGDLALPQIDIPAVERFRNKLTASGQSNFSVCRILNTLSLILEHARRHRIVQHNPVRDVEKPKARPRKKAILLTTRELHDLAACAPTKDETRMILAAAFTGTRFAELIALRWENIDLADDGGALRIVEQYYRDELVDRTKTPTGAREIPFGAVVAAILREQAADGRYSSQGLVFPSPEGHYWHASNFNRRQWATTRKRAGMTDLHFHHLRHFYVSMMRNQGLPTSVTEQLVGHSDERTHRGYTQQTATFAQVVREASDNAFQVAP